MRSAAHTVNKETIKTVFQGIQAQFPHLKMELKLDDPSADLMMDIPSQERLKFPMALKWQDDVLVLYAGEEYSDHWHPYPGEVENFRRVVCGLLSGEYRVLEYYRGSLVVGGEFQRLSGEGWVTCGGWGPFLWVILPWWRRWVTKDMITKELRNV